MINGSEASAQEKMAPVAAGNPVIKDKYTADPAALIYGDSVYLYTGHDEGLPAKDGYIMHEWLSYSSADMQHWKESTYKMMVGRSEKIMSFYVDRDGLAMNLGGGSILLQGNKNWHGVSHSAGVNFNDTDYLVFHGYDDNDHCKSKLRIDNLNWHDGWPVVLGNPE